jgi:dihydroorotase
MENTTLPSSVTHTFVNGNLVYENGLLHEEISGMRLKFDRN